MNQATELYVCSSRRHLYIAAGLAMNSPARSHLLVIDQAQEQPDQVVAALRDTPGLFASVVQRRKPKGRRGQSSELAYCRDWVAQHQPIAVYAGNDRKYQFQYLVKCASEHGGCQGIYMDDGTGTYESGIHLNFWRGFFDRTVIALIKRFSIGLWYHRARYFGGCVWVNECRVQHPHLMPMPVRDSKPVTALDAAIFRQQDNLQRLERCFIGHRPQLEQLDELRALVVLPYSKHVPSGAAFDRFERQIRQAVQGSSPVGIKYHPREKCHYFPAADDDIVIDQDIPAEILFSRCDLQSIVGDTSSALLSAQWLQTSANILSLCPHSERQAPLTRLLERSGVKIQTYL